MNLLCLLYPFITTALYHLGARAMLTQPLWSRYPAAFDRFMSCPACSGTWYGFLVGALGWWCGIPLLGVDHVATIPVVGLASLVWTPFLAAQHERAIQDVTGPVDAAVPEAVYDDETRR